MTMIAKITGLAIVDAINPCALSVMVIVLMTLLMQYPEKRKRVLLGGFSFTLAVFILYFLYGLIMVRFFAYAIPEVGNYAYYVFKGFGVFAIILGVLNLKDYFVYHPGGLATEMPLIFRPKMKLWIKKITGPKGAFVVGIVVTLFLLPCTIGPYIIASVELSSLSFIQTLFWLLYYNLVFIIPMVAITLIIYFGLTTVGDVGGWKERNIRRLHLIEGLILTVIGILMFTGVI